MVKLGLMCISILNPALIPALGSPILDCYLHYKLKSLYVFYDIILWHFAKLSKHNTSYNDLLCKCINLRKSSMQVMAKRNLPDHPFQYLPLAETTWIYFKAWSSIVKVTFVGLRLNSEGCIRNKCSAYYAANLRQSKINMTFIICPFLCEGGTPLPDEDLFPHVSWKCKNLIDIYGWALFNLRGVETPAANFGWIIISICNTHEHRR